MPDSRRARLQFDLAYVIGLTQRRMRARFTERLKAHDQTVAQWSVLYVLAEEPGGLIQAEVAERVGVQGPTVVKLIDALEAQGMVSRRAEPGDRRAKRLFIEEPGLRAREEVDKVAAAWRDEAFQTLTDEEIIATTKVMQRIADRAKPKGEG